MSCPKHTVITYDTVSLKSTMLTFTNVSAAGTTLIIMFCCSVSMLPYGCFSESINFAWSSALEGLVLSCLSSWAVNISPHMLKIWNRYVEKRVEQICYEMMCSWFTIIPIRWRTQFRIPSMRSTLLNALHGEWPVVQRRLPTQYRWRTSLRKKSEACKCYAISSRCRFMGPWNSILLHLFHFLLFFPSCLFLVLSKSSSIRISWILRSKSKKSGSKVLIAFAERV